MRNCYNEWITERIKSNLPLPPPNKKSDEYKDFIMNEIKSGRGLPPIEERGYKNE